MTDRVRGASPVVDVSADVDREAVEYLKAEDAVRYVSGRLVPPDDPSGEREPVWKTVPFEQWAATECGRAARERAMKLVRERLDGDAACVSAETGADDGEFPSRTVTVVRRTTLDRDGRIRFAPNATFEVVRAASPSAVSVTVELGGREHAETVPVYVAEQTVREQ